VRAALVVGMRQYLDLERYELERVALALAAGQGFANPYSLATGPTAHVSPGYPIILSQIYRLFGTGIPAELVKQLLACAVTALQCALIPTVARILGFTTITGLTAGTLSALLPLKFQTETTGDWEANYTALALLLLPLASV